MHASQTLNRGGLLGEPQAPPTPRYRTGRGSANILPPKKILLVLHYCDAIFAAIGMLTINIVYKQEKS